LKRRCARRSCRRLYWADPADQFITCPDCRLYWNGEAKQIIPHARDRKLTAGDGGELLKVADLELEE
jgi:hypothetical protein